MKILGIILTRAGSKGLTDKCVRDLHGRPLIDYTFDHALASDRLTRVILTTDSKPAAKLGAQRGIAVVDRPAKLATDTATVDAAARHAVESWETEHDRIADAIVLLYGNIPVRRNGIIDDVVDHLVSTRADSVRTVAPVSKQHPDWIHRLDGDRMIQFRPNSIYRRQDLEPLFYHDGAVLAVTRSSLFARSHDPNDHHAFMGKDRRAVVQRPEDTVDVDTILDLHIAEAILTAQRFENRMGTPP
jgi:CMP-N-acetylneuraminic acid synthetase